jgi:deoxycytidylate deaminase
MTFGQMTRKIFVESDLFICNDQKLEELRRKVSRYIQLLFDSQIHTPTRAESAMYEANSVAPKSACMSRQVGAAIISSTGELIAVGWNDVPRFGGGLYVEDDQAVWDVTLKSVQDKDHRCFKHGRKICHNETRRTKILDDIASKIVLSGLLRKGADYKEVRELLAGTAIDSLTEFSRSIHAEMEAILSVAREGRHSLVGATLFTTTYPCHNCARHIVAAGIAKVIYIEPYKKSLATVLHDDSVTEDVNDATRVVFSQYDGVAPSRYLQVFRPTRPRKLSGRLSITNAAELTPIFQIPLDSPMDYESIIIANLSDKEDNLLPTESGL